MEIECVCVYSAYFFGMCIHVVVYSCSQHESQNKYKKMDKFDYVNIKSLCVPKVTIYSQKTNARLEILVTHMSCK